MGRVFIRLLLLRVCARVPILCGQAGAACAYNGLVTMLAGKVGLVHDAA